MMEQKKTPKVQNQHQILISLPRRKRRVTEQISCVQKQKNFEEERQISPKQINHQKNFSDRFSVSKKKKIKVKKIIKTEIILIQTVQSPCKCKNQSCRNSLKKYSQKRNSIKKPNLNRISSENALRKLNIRQRSGTSTLASSQKSEKQSILVGQSTQQDQLEKLNNFLVRKNDISLNKKYKQFKTQNDSNQTLKISDFQILNFCGEGTSGSVFIARHKQTGYVCALKKIIKKSVNDKQDQQSLIREIKIHMKLNHPNIIKFHGFFSSQNAIYFILELCNEGNLFQMLQKYGTLKEKQVKQITRQVCNGIDYLHYLGIIHRDIKAQNIVIHDKVVKICDFGWSTKGDHPRKTLCGTPAYASPYLIRNELYDKKIDIWSLGVLTYQLLFGRIPFQLRCNDDFQKIIKEDLAFPPEFQISKSCKDFITKCLEKNPSKRLDASKLLTHQFLQKQEISLQNKY